MEEEKQTKVIADGLLSEALQQTLNAVAFQGSYISADEILIVYAHSLTEKILTRSSQGGLKSLQQILAEPRSRPAGVLILGFVPPSDLGRYGYLVRPYGPFLYVQLPLSEPLPICDAISGPEWRDVTRIASEEELEQQCSSFRHGLQSVMAAARIYLGAAIVCHANPQYYDDVLAEFSDLAQRQGALNAIDSTSLSKSLQSHRRFCKDYRNIRRPKNCKLWVLDDHWEDQGWKTAFSQLPLGLVRGFSDWSSLKKMIESNQDKPSVLFIDCNLGHGGNIPTGLELLRSIRSGWQAVRIVFATSYDDAALALTSLREGANVFFAKALNDTGDRRSKDYYERLVKLLEINRFEQAVLSLWRRFKEVATNDLFNQGEFPAALEPMLRIAFYMLFSFLDDNLWWRKSRMRFPRKHVFRAVINLVRAGYPELEDDAFVNDKPVGLVLKGSPHGSAPITFDELCSVLNYLFTRLEQSLNRRSAAPIVLDDWARSWPHYWPYSPDELQTDSNYPGLPSGSTISAHEVLDSQGAIELLRGACCTRRCRHAYTTAREILKSHGQQPSPNDYQDIVFIDDRGENNEWFMVMRLLFPGCRTYSDPSSFYNNPGQVSLLILDLRLPLLERGMESLRRILALDPSVPILTLSASNQSLAAIRSLREGAIDFVSKTLPGGRDLEGCFLFADEFRQKCKMLLEYGRSDCREAASRLEQLRNGPSWQADALASVQERINKCSAHRNRSRARTSWQVPPNAKDWAVTLADEIALLIHLQRQLYWIKAKKKLKANKNRIRFEREYQARPLDHWRWKAVLGFKGSSDIIKLMAIVAGVTIERLARWQTCLLKEESLDPRLWGSESYNRTEIAEAIERTLGRDALFIWTTRNAALYPDRVQPDWDQSLCDKLVSSVFGVISSFFKTNGAKL